MHRNVFRRRQNRGQLPAPG